MNHLWTVVFVYHLRDLSRQAYVAKTTSFPRGVGALGAIASRALPQNAFHLHSVLEDVILTAR